ncbi:MAG: hypothetical protein R2991_14475 [Thermoanaerobaculia bacterium]
MSIEVRLLEAKACRAPGETVRAEVRWSADFAPEGVEVRLLWETRGKGDREEGVAATVEVPAPARQGEHTVELTLPQGPWSYEGRLLQIVWLLDAVLWPSGEQARADLVVSPLGRALTPLIDVDEEEDGDDLKY